MSYSSLVSDFLVDKRKLNNTERMREANGIASWGRQHFWLRSDNLVMGSRCVCTQNSVCLLAFVNLLMGNFTAFEGEKNIRSYISFNYTFKTIAVD